MTRTPAAMARHVAITGASSGLGAALARSYAMAGRHLTLVGRSAARLDAVAEDCMQLGATVRTGLFDVGAPEPLGGWLLHSDTELPIDLLIANAGTSGGPRGAGVAEGRAIAARQIHTNLLGCINTVEPLLPRMLARGVGHVAVISSVAGYRGLPYSPAYSASKAGVRVYGDALRAQLTPSGLAVTVVVPGFFESPMTDRFKGAKPFLLTLDQAAATVRRGLDRRIARIVFPRLLGWGIQAADVMHARLGDAILRGVHFHIEASRDDLALQEFAS